jgi:multimeric flavodoxin WrbA
MKRILIVHHTQFGATLQVAQAARDGAQAIDGIDVVFLRAADAGVPELLGADAVIVATSENFGGMAGVVKDFFERTYYPCEGKLEGRPYALIVCAGTDGTGAVRDVERVATGLRLRQIAPPIVYKSGVTAQRVIVPEDVLAHCRDLGATLAAGVDAGIY